MINKMSTILDGQELAVGDEIEALGAAPGSNGRAWSVVPRDGRSLPAHPRQVHGYPRGRDPLPRAARARDCAYVNADGVRRIAC